MNNKKTILYIGGFELPDKNAAAHLVINNAKIFKKLGYTVIFYGVSKEIKNKDEVKHDIIDSFECFAKPYPKNSIEWCKDFFNIGRYKQIIDEHPDIKFLITYNIHSYQMLKLIKYCRKKKIYIISNVTEWYENKISIKPINFIKFLDTNIVMKILNKKVDGIISISSYLKKYYDRYINNIVVIPPLIDIHDKKWNNTYKSSNVIKFVYSGSPETNDTKDRLYPIIKCLYNLKEYNFVFSIIGITKEQFLFQHPDMEELLKELNNKVVFYGRVSHARSIEELFNSDYSIFIRDSTRKNNAGFPTKFVEGYTSGINIIASNISDIKCYFPNSDMSILLKNNDEKTIQDSLAICLKNSKKVIKQKRRNGLIENPFDYNKWVNIVDSFLSKYK